MILGITGGTGSGKTTLLQCIAEKGGVILDCDQIYHGLLQSDASLLCAIEEAFPGTVTDGVLDRKALGKLVFSDEASLLRLNAITHSAVKKEVLRQLEAAPSLAAIDAIGLLEGGLAPLCDVTVAVTAPEAVRIRRLMARDGISQDYARSRIQAQHTDDWFREHCDYVLENDSDLPAFHSKCLAFLERLGIIES